MTVSSTDAVNSSTRESAGERLGKPGKPREGVKQPGKRDDNQKSEGEKMHSAKPHLKEKKHKIATKFTVLHLKQIWAGIHDFPYPKATKISLQLTRMAVRDLRFLEFLWSGS